MQNTQLHIQLPKDAYEEYRQLKKNNCCGGAVIEFASGVNITEGALIPQLPKFSRSTFIKLILIIFEPNFNETKGGDLMTTGLLKQE